MQLPPAWWSILLSLKMILIWVFSRRIKRENFGRESASVAEVLVGKGLVKLHPVAGREDRLFKGRERFAGIYEGRHEVKILYTADKKTSSRWIYLEIKIYFTPYFCNFR